MALNYRRSMTDACSSFKEAFLRDPEYAAAYAMAAWVIAVPQMISGASLPVEERSDAIRFAQLASRLGREDAFALARSAHVLAYLAHEYDQAETMIEQAVALNPNLAAVWYSRGWVSVMCGEPERAIESFDRMVRLSPLDPSRAGAWYGIACAHNALGRYDEGCACATRAIQNQIDANSLGVFVINAIPAGRCAEACEAVEQLLRLRPDFRVSDVPGMFATRDAEWRNRMVLAFREAGTPE
jgi:adenylate cyclase